MFWQKKHCFFTCSFHLRQTKTIWSASFWEKVPRIGYDFTILIQVKILNTLNVTATFLCCPCQHANILGIDFFPNECRFFLSTFKVDIEIKQFYFHLRKMILVSLKKVFRNRSFIIIIHQVFINLQLTMHAKKCFKRNRFLFQPAAFDCSSC